MRAINPMPQVALGMTDSEYAAYLKRCEAGCRTCSECVGYSHHWIEDPDFHSDYSCKHCPAVGEVCTECLGEGCRDCDREGVMLLVPERN